MEEPRSSIVWQEFHDRTAGLVVFGLIQIGFGVLSLMFVPFLALVTTFSPQTASGQSPASMAGGMFVYGALGVVFITLGVGSLLTRRWARAVALAVWSLWLAYGITALVSGALLLTMYGDSLEATMAAFVSSAPGTPPGQARAMSGMFEFMILFGTIAVVVLGILLPLPFVLFYRSRHVKATCEWRDAKTRWTDRCPVPVIAAALLILGYGTYAVQGLAFQRLYMVGVLFEGPAALVAVALGVGASVAAAVGLCRMRLWGWGLSLALVLVYLFTWAWAEYAGDTSFFRMMDERSLKILQQTEGAQAFLGSLMHWGTAVHVVFLLYLLWILRYFRATRRPAAVV